ncbi:MAG TPA: holdfast anchoring protein HfaA [Rhizomicrobium sp.]|jgi:holdfast attachment protein HfaA|nr:holdfast anchoring protein HfaA [Rhizomicrobium sp.]
MSKFKTRSLLMALTAGLAVAVLAGPLAAQAQTSTWTNSAMYNGYGANNMNSASSYSMRDANGNLTMVNGQLQPSIYSNASGSQFASSGVGTAGAAGEAYGQATAIGNSLNVTVIGTHNTTIIDNQQTNTGNQTATAAVNTH